MGQSVWKFNKFKISLKSKPCATKGKNVPTPTDEAEAHASIKENNVLAPTDEAEAPASASKRKQKKTTDLDFCIESIKENLVPTQMDESAAQISKQEGHR